MKTSIVIIGGSFSGLTAAFDLKYALKSDVDITVIDQKDYFVFTPSLVWVIPGWCEPDTITFDLKSALANREITFVQARAEHIKPEWNQVCTTHGNFSYDYLIIATGAHPDWSAIPGLGPQNGYTHSVCSLPHAIEAHNAWEQLLRDPGPVVLGTTQGASCFGAEYEVALNLDSALRQAGLRDQAPVIFLTAAPSLGYHQCTDAEQGVNQLEAWFTRHNIKYITNVVIDHVTPYMIQLHDGRSIPFKYAMLIPPLKGTNRFHKSPGLVDERGFIPVDAHYQHTRFSNIYAAGVVVADGPHGRAEAACGVPRTGLICETMAKAVARNIVADVTGKPAREIPSTNLKTMCASDTESQGMMPATERPTSPRRQKVFDFDPWWRWLKLGSQRYHLWKMRTGRVYLP